jgi:hypothetical protein
MGIGSMYVPRPPCVDHDEAVNEVRRGGGKMGDEHPSGRETRGGNRRFGADNLAQPGGEDFRVILAALRLRHGS